MEFLNNIDTDKIIEFVQMGGPIVGIMLPIIEAFFPVLPLVLFVTINVTVFGFFFGYLYSWVGSCVGSFLLFLAIRKIGGNKIEKKINNSKYIVALDKIRQNNFSVLFVLYCFPFTPSCLLSGASALANMKTKQFLIALIPSKFIMLISLAFIGVNVKSFFHNPVKSVMYVILVLLINVVIKKIVENSRIFVVKRKKK